MNDQMFPFFGIALAYLLGCLVGAYYLTRALNHKDIRSLGSGTAGARNTARVLGLAPACLVFGWDFFKGFLATWAGDLLGTSPPWIIASAVAVVLGHILPIQLNFRGGKGIATSLGASLVLAQIGGSTLMAGLAILSTIVVAAHLIARPVHVPTIRSQP